MKHVAYFGDGEKTFALTMPMIAELERKTGVGSVGDIITKGAFNTRLKAIETKNDARLDKLEAKANRLPASNDNQADDALETKAFTDFLRSGQIDQKSLTVPGWRFARLRALNRIKRNWRKAVRTGWDSP